MPLKLTRRKADHPKGPSGTRVFAAVKRSGWFEHTVTGAARTARVAIGVSCRNYRGRATASNFRAFFVASAVMWGLGWACPAVSFWRQPLIFHELYSARHDLAQIASGCAWP